MLEFKWKETKSAEGSAKARPYHESLQTLGDTSVKYFGEIEYEDYSTCSETKRVGLTYLSDIRDAYEEYRKNDLNFAY